MNLLTKIFGISNSNPPQKVKQGLETNFPDARSVEWTPYKKYYEAIFYEQDIEKIARFDPEGNLTETRINIAPSSIPDWLRNKTDEELEIMNCISVLKNEGTAYELIVRDKELIRYVIQVDTTRQISAKEKL